MKAIGHGGELRVGYQCAATLGSWRLEVTPTLPSLQFVVEATINAVDRFWIAQKPLVLDLQFGRFHWIWEGIHPEVSEGNVLVRAFGKPIIVREQVCLSGR